MSCGWTSNQFVRPRPSMEILFLGTGTSHGVPVVGCDCDTCRSEDPRNQRLRSSVMVRTMGLNVLIDTSTDFRQQCLRYDIRRIEMIGSTINTAKPNSSDVPRMRHAAGPKMPKLARTMGRVLMNAGKSAKIRSNITLNLSKSFSLPDRRPNATTTPENPASPTPNSTKIERSMAFICRLSPEFKIHIKRFPHIRLNFTTSAFGRKRTFKIAV